MQQPFCTLSVKHFLKLCCTGIIESELVAIPAMQKRLEEYSATKSAEQLLLKR